MKPFTAIVAALLTIGAVVHLVRFFAAWPISVGDYLVPVWWSLPGCVIVGLLAVMLWREARST